MGTNRRLQLAVLIFVFLFSTPASAVIDIGSDFVFSGLNFRDLNIRTRNYLEIGGQGFGLGPVAHYERVNNYTADVIAGVGFRIGQRPFVAVDGGFYRRTYQGVRGDGYAGVLTIGYALTNWFRVSVPIVVKRITRGDLANRWLVNYIPYIGFKLGI